MKILIGCEYSGTLRDMFIAFGHDAVSCDIIDSVAGGPHIVGDLLQVGASGEWDAMVAFPPCTDIASSGNRWMNKKIVNQRTQAGIQFVADVWALPIRYKAIENPKGILATRWRRADQIVHPWMFGSVQRKETHLWLDGLPRLIPRVIARPWYVKDTVGNLGMRGHGDVGRGRVRSKLDDHLAMAMAGQWGDWLRERLPC